MRGRARLFVSVSLVAMVGYTLAGIFITPVKTAAQSNTQNFSISSFDADYYLDRDFNGTSTLRVTETINAVFPEYDQNHGILRAVPKNYQGHTVSLSIQSVRDPQGVLQYTTYDENDNTVLKIGNANTYVHGAHTYIIQYTLRNVISFQNDHDELYWDVNGDGWSQPFGTVTARIHIPVNIAKQMQKRQVCYEGGRGSNNSKNCTISNSEDDNADRIILTESHYLQPHSTLTFVLGFNKGLFKQGPEIRQEKLKRYAIFALIGGAIVLPPLITFSKMFHRWRRIGRDPKGRGVIVPEYVPPKDFNPLTSDFMLAEKLRDTAISASLIDLAVRKYIAIIETEGGSLFKKKSYELELLNTGEDLTPQEKKVLEMFFGVNAEIGKRINVKDLKNKLAKDTAALGNDISKLLFERGYFATNPQTIRKKYAAIGTTLIVLSAAAGFFTVFLLPIAAGAFLSGAIVLAFSKIMPARSVKGTASRDALFGLKDYMKLAEAERLNYLQSPAGAEKIAAAAEAGLDPTNPRNRVKLFEKLLPYAMLFGIEQEWAKQFADVYKQAPDWYHGNWSTFNTMYLVNSVGGFTASNAASFTAPSSSSSSGFGGGGFSGGGGGGGGGGGW